MSSKLKTVWTVCMHHSPQKGKSSCIYRLKKKHSKNSIILCASNSSRLIFKNRMLVIMNRQWYILVNNHQFGAQIHILELFWKKKSWRLKKQFSHKKKASGNFLKIKVKSVNNIINNIVLTLSWSRTLSYRNQSIDLQSKSMDWFLYDIGLRHKSVK